MMMLCAINLYNIAVALSGGCHFHLNTVTSYLGFLSMSSVPLCRHLYSTILRATVLYVTWLVHNRKLLERLWGATLGQKFNHQILFHCTLPVNATAKGIGFFTHRGPDDVRQFSGTKPPTNPCQLQNSHQLTWQERIFVGKYRLVYKKN